MRIGIAGRALFFQFDFRCSADRKLVQVVWEMNNFRKVNLLLTNTMVFKENSTNGCLFITAASIRNTASPFCPLLFSVKMIEKRYQIILI